MKVALETARAALFFALVLGLVASFPARADDEEAGTRFDKGVELTKLGDYDGALVEFRAAYDAAPDYRVSYNIGICLYRLGRYVEALTELSAYLAEGGDAVPQDRRIEVESILQEITTYIGALEVECNVDGAWILVDGRPAGETPLAAPLFVDVGEHQIVVQKKGWSSFMSTVSVPGGKTVAIEANLSQAKGLSKQDKQKIFQERATGLFIGGEAITAAGLLAVPATSLAWFAGDGALEVYAVPSVGLLAVGGTVVLALSHTRAARNLVSMGIGEDKRARVLRIAAWIFVGTTVAAEAGFWLMNGLFNLYDGRLSGCLTGECGSTRDARRGFMVGTYLMMGALVGSVALAMGLGTAAWVLVGRRIAAQITADESEPVAPASTIVTPFIAPLEGGTILGLAGTF